MSAELITEEQLNEIVKAEGAKHGYTDTVAKFVSLKDFKVKWTRTKDWISMDFSDYLQVLSVTALKDLVAGTFKGIETGGRAEYGAAFRRSVGSKKFLRANQDRYLTRSKLIHHTEYKDVPNLSEAYQRVIGRGLLERDPNFMMAWKAWPVFAVPYRASGVFKTAIFNTSLFQDSEGNSRNIPEDCLDYLVYCAAVDASYLLPTSEELDERERKKAEYPDAEDILAKLWQFDIAGDY